MSELTKWHHQLRICDICAKQKILVINETKRDKIYQNQKFRTKKNFVKYCELSLKFCGLYYKRVTIINNAPSVVKVTLQIVASLTIVTRL